MVVEGGSVVVAEGGSVVTAAENLVGRVAHGRAQVNQGSGRDHGHQRQDEDVLDQAGAEIIRLGPSSPHCGQGGALPPFHPLTAHIVGASSLTASASPHGSPPRAPPLMSLCCLRCWRPD